MSEKSEEFIIVCAYCNRCYGKYINKGRIYFPPIDIINPTARMSHGICPDCLKELMEEEELY